MPAPPELSDPAMIVAPSEARVDEADLRRQLVARDYLEAVCFSFVDAGLLEQWQCSADTVPLAGASWALGASWQSRMSLPTWAGSISPDIRISFSATPWQGC